MDNFTKYILTISAVIGLTFAVMPQAEAQDNDNSLILSIAGIANAAAEDVRTSGDGGTSRDDLNYGIGALVEANIGQIFGLESGVLYIRRVYEARSEALNSAVVQEVDRLHIPVVARFWLSDFFSLAAGPYFSFKVGDVENSVQVGNFDASYSSSAGDDIEWGLDFAATANLAIAEKTGVFIEGRYSMDLDKQENERSDQISGLVGVKLDIGG